MKRLKCISLILILAFIFPLIGCGGVDYAPEPEAVVEMEVESDDVEEVWEAEPEEWVDVADEEELEDEFTVTPRQGLGIHGLISRVELGDNVVYIFGSMHMGRSEWYPLHQEVEDAMRRSDAFVFETDITDEGMMMATPLMMEHMFLENMTLSEFLEEGAFEHLMEVVATYGISYQAIRGLTPWVVSIMLAEIAYSRVGITANYGVDFYVMGFAQAHNRPILYLNPIEHEIELAFNLTEELQHYAALSVENFDVAIQQVERLVQAYETQDIDLITTLIRESSITGETPNPLEIYMIEVIVIQRSIEFAREIIRLLEETGEATTFFVTMGIGHLVGEDYGNVFNYLMDAGFQVEPLH